MSLYTQGPWNVGEDGDIFSDDCLCVATVVQGVYEETHNRALIVVAPEMYELLARLNTAFYAGSPKELRAVFAETKPLLRKARGHTEKAQS